MYIAKIVSFFYRKLLKPIFFKFDPEWVHDRISFWGRIMGKIAPLRFMTKIFFRYDDPSLVQEIAGIKFSNPIGLSAGFDKDANLPGILYEVGFGFAQVGSVTLKPYAGNPKPRLYRLPKSKAVVVYYGLKNIGIEKIIPRVRKLRRDYFPLSISIAKTNSESTNTDEKGVEDYYQTLKLVEAEQVGDFYTINISCPNTFGGEPFTTPDKLGKLLKRLFQVKLTKPLFVKMPIDLTWKEFDGLLKICVKYGVTGVVIGNLTKDRQASTIKEEIPAHIKGGISGKPTWELSNNLISKTYQYYGKQLLIIGVGGIFTGEDAYHKIKLGSSLVQLITGMIFQGPASIGLINKELAELLKKDGFANIKEAVGSAHK